MMNAIDYIPTKDAKLGKGRQDCQLAFKSNQLVFGTFENKQETSKSTGEGQRD